MIGPVQGPAGGVASLVEALRASRISEEYDLSILDTGQKGRRQYSPDVPGSLTPLYTILHLMRLHRLLHREKPEIVHIQSCCGLAFLRDSLFIMIARAWRKKVVCHFHGMLCNQYSLFRNRFLRSYFRWVMRYVDVLIVLAPRFASEFDTLIAQTRKSVVPNFVPSFSHTDRAPQSGMGVLFVGRLSTKKGIYELLKAAVLVKNEPGIRFCLAGLEETSADKDRILAELKNNDIQDRVYLAGHVRGAQKDQLFASSDILVLPSHTEMLPMVIIEAMAAGMPVIATPVGAVPDMIEDGVNGFLVPTGDHNMLAERILHLSRHPDKRAEMGRNNLRKFNQEYSVEVNINRIIEIYESLLQPTCCSTGQDHRLATSHVLD
jgi:glycosyltransferase involved in cell wall biosynthesis